MGLDWLVQSKVVDGRTIEPAETAGRKELDPKDPESIALLEEHRKEMRTYWPLPGPMPTMEPATGGRWSFIDALLGSEHRRRLEYEEKLTVWRNCMEEAERYHIPLEQALPSFVAEDPPYVVQEAAPDRQDALAKYGGDGSCYDFCGDELRDDLNAVTAHAAYVMKMEFTDELYLDREPPEMLALAKDLSRALGHYLKNEDDKDQDSIDIVRAVIPWLRFWGRAGHGFVADY